MAHRSEDIRNVALFGHGSSGKTALVDALAFATKASTRHGNSADGSSISDTDAEEQDRRQTLTSHVFGFEYEGSRLNVIDTPGHPDFIADVISAFGVVEIAILCVSASSGLTFHARRLWAEAGKASVGRAIVVTHPDNDNAKFAETLAGLIGVLGDTVVPVTCPDGDAAAFTCVHDVLGGDNPRAAEFREKLEERVAEADDSILEAYLDSGSLSPDDIEKYLPMAIQTGKICPLFTVAPPRELGLNKLCAFIKRYFVSPGAAGPRTARLPDSEAYDQTVEPTPDGPFVGRVFKTVADPYVGRQSYIRCLRGTLKAESGLFNVRTGKHDKLTGLLEMVGGDAKPMPQVVAGDLFVVGKLEDLNLGDTVSADSQTLMLPPIDYPLPTYSLAVNPAARGDEQKITQGLEKLAAEDPTFVVRRDTHTGELLISGMSPLHLDVQLARLKRRYGIGTEQHAPTIPYKETITGKADGHHRHKKQSGGRGQFAEVYLRVAPLDRGVGFEYVDSVVGGSIPRQFIPEIEKGIRKLLTKGFLAGCKIEDIQAEVYDGKFHDVDSDQISFQLAGERAFLEASQKARPILLEPIMEVEIHVPERFTGDVSSNLATLRGRMSGMEMQEGIQVIRAQVPMKEMQEYSTQLRSITAGEGTFSMRESHYEPVPPNIQQEIVKAHQRKLEGKA